MHVGLSKRLMRRSPAIALAALAAIAGCSEPIPTQDTPIGDRPRAYSSVTAYSATVGSVEMSIDTLDMTARLRKPSTGQEVYAELTGEQAAQLAEMLVTIDHGQAWYEATGSVNPLENAPPGWQPQDNVPGPAERRTGQSVRELIEMAKSGAAVSLGTLDEKNVRARIVAVLRAKDRSVIASRGRDPRRGRTDQFQVSPTLTRRDLLVRILPRPSPLIVLCCKIVGTG